MARCNFCGKEIASNKNMVLVGQKKFVQGAGNGRVWVGEAPSVRFWKTFALISVGICPECINKDKRKSFIINMAVFFLSILYIVFFISITRPESTNLQGFLAFITAVLFIVSLIAAIVSIILFFINLRIFRHNKEKIGDIAISHYHKMIPKKDILGIVGESIDDFSVLEKTKVNDPFLGMSYNFELKLYSEEELDKIGVSVDGAQNRGDEEAYQDAKRLFNSIK